MMLSRSLRFFAVDGFGRRAHSLALVATSMNGGLVASGDWICDYLGYLWLKPVCGLTAGARDLRP